MELASFIITNKGQALMAKLMQGTGTCDFTNIRLSSQVYSDAQIPGLTSLANVKQTAPVTKKTVINSTSIQIEGAVDNTQLATGYNIQTIGIYATDPDDGEILYAAARAITAGYMPPYNGITVSGGVFKFVITVGASSQVTLTVDPAGYASIADIQSLEAEVSDVKAYVGMTDDDIFGVEVDFVNKTFTRLGGAVGRNAGAGFDSIAPWGGRYRCNLTDAGVELCKYGETGYTETGALISAVEKDGVTYAIGTAVQVMVKQPKFYYKVVPLKVERISGGTGYHLRKARYFVSPNPKLGFKLHPLFKGDKDFVYLSAYEGSIYDVSASTYILDDDVVADFTSSTGDKLCSIANAKPASGISNDLTRRKCGILAENRGSGWYQSFIEATCATELLFLIEYNSFNTQNKIGAGNTSKTDDGSTSMTELTGATANLGNASGSVQNTNNINIVSYRGEENFWGNIWKWVDGLTMYDHVPYVCDDFAFEESKKTGNYKEVGFTAAGSDGYISAYGYDENYDWLFIASEVGANSANSSVPVGDYYYQNTGYRVATLGGDWHAGGTAGGFSLGVGNAPSARGRYVGGRLAYVPGAA